MKQYIGDNKKVWGKYDGTTLFKDKLKKEHLLYKYGGVPAWDKKMYDSIKPKQLYFYTEDGEYQIDYEKFEHHKEEIDYQYGKQYVVPIEHWTIKS